MFEKAPTLRSSTEADVCYAIEGSMADRETSKNGKGWCERVSPTMNTQDRHAVVYVCRGNGTGNIVPTLTGDHQNRVTDYTSVICGGNGQPGNATGEPVANTLDCMHDQQFIVAKTKQQRKYIVRRLTPLECCRLQGFPDWWEDGVEGSDSARYKMWGNGIALPCAVDVLGRVAKAMGGLNHAKLP